MTISSPPVFHVGLGKLGLGMVVPRLAPYLRVIGCHRASSQKREYAALRDQQRYQRVFHDTGSRDVIAVAGVAAYKSAGLVEIAEEHGLPAVVTCAMKEGYPQVFGLITDLIARHREHYRRNPLLFVPFENARNVGSDALAYVARRVPGAESALLAVDTVVDKLCSDVATEDGMCVVHTESHETLMIGIPSVLDAARVHDALTAVGLETHVLPRRRFDFEVRKKAWIVNGLHYCIVMAAYERDLEADDIPKVLADEAIADVARRFIVEVAAALEVYAAEHGVDLERDEILNFTKETLHRVRTTPDSLKRIAGRFFSPLHDFIVGVTAGIEIMPGPLYAGDALRKWSERINEPAEIVLRVHTAFEDPLVTPWLSLRLLESLGLYLTLRQESPAAGEPARTS
jgi:hypothetical protein